MVIVQTGHRRKTAWKAILISFAIALLVLTIPLPDWAMVVRPDLVSVVLVAWCFIVPTKVGVASGWFAGLLLDALQFTVLGQNAISKAAIAYLAVRMQPRVRSVLIWQQMIAVFILLCIDVAIVTWIRSLFGESPISFSTWVSVFIGTLLWPFVFLTLQRFNPRFN